MQDLSGTTNLRPSRPVSRRDALRCATALSALAGLGAASTRAAVPAAAAAAPTLIDFAMRQIPAQDIRAAGHSGVINYVSLSRPGSSFGAKPITRSYAESLTAAGLAIVSNYQYGKPGGSAPSDFTRGFAGGVSDARTAWQLHTAAGGGQSAPIFFTVDDDILECSAPASMGASMRASGRPPMVLSGIRARPAAGGPGRRGPGLTVRSTPPQFSTSAW
jgi:hypothetical protein